MISLLTNFFYNVYLLSGDDLGTFVLPNTVFGLATAMTASLHKVTGQNPIHLTAILPDRFLLAVLNTIIFNWSNLVIFNLANQRESSHEDRANKPWRLIPSGRMTPARMKHILLVAVPSVITFNHFYFGTAMESSLLVALAWMYNDLGGGDDDFALRNFIIACAFGVYNLGSMKVAASYALPSVSVYQRQIDIANTIQVTRLGYIWTAVISAIIFTTMHVQDLQDEKGDRLRGRRSAPIVFGRRVASWSVAICVVFASVFCVQFWNAPLPASLTTLFVGSLVAWRCIRRSGPVADRRTWHLWCAWTAVLYLLPPIVTLRL